MKKILIVLSILIILVGCSGKTARVYSENDNKEFNTYLDGLFVDIMDDDLTNLYFSLNDYKNFGITKPEATLGTVDFSQEDIDVITRRKSELEAFNYDDLSLIQQEYYTALNSSYDSSLESSRLQEFNFMFRPSTGLTTNLLTIFMEYKFRDLERLDDYVLLLKDVDRLLDDAISYSEKQAAMGIFLSDSAIDATISGIDRFIGLKDDNQLIVSFNDRMNNIDFIDEKAKGSYIESNQEIVLNEVIPAFNRVKESLSKLKGSNKYEGGLANYPGGKDYYSTIVKNKAGTGDSADEVFNSVKSYTNNLMMNLQSMVTSNGKAFSEYVNYTPKNKGASFMISNLMANSEPYFIKGPDIEYEVTFLDESITDENISAYYMIPTFDDLTENVIRINPKYNEEQPLRMYLTLAHEGYPGHMYQFTYYYGLNPHAIASVLGEIGYSEGWAMYSSLYAYDMLELENEATKEFFKFDERFNYTISALVDMGVNYYGWSLETMIAELATVGFDLNTQLELAETLYQGVIDEPGQVLPYAIGLIEFENYLMKVEGALKDKFDIKDYHKMLIECGPISFDKLDYYVDEYIETHK